MPATNIDETDLLRAVIAAPDDDAARAVLGDWWAERGDARGELMHVQLRLAGIDAGGEDDARSEERDRLVDREEELRAALGDAGLWPAGLPGRPTVVRRGLVEGIAIGARALVEHADAIFATAPIVELRVELAADDAAEAADLLGALSRLQWLGGVRSLDLSEAHWGSEAETWVDEPLAEAEAQQDRGPVLLGDAVIAALADSPHLGGLARLRLADAAVSDEGIARLVRPARSTRMRGIRALDLSGNLVGVDGLRALARAAHLTLEALALGRMRIGVEGAAALASPPATALANLRRLDLGSPPDALTTCDLGDEGAATLGEAQWFGGLEALDLTNTGIGAAALVYMGWMESGPSHHRSEPAGRFHRLRALRLGHNLLGVDGARVLAAMPALGRLRALGLPRTGLGADGLRVLLGAPAFQRSGALGWLDLGYDRLGPDGARALAASPALAAMETLALRGDHLTDAGALALAASPHLGPRLRHLDLAQNRIGDLGARALASSSALGGLRHLDLQDNQITGDGAAALRTSAAPARLRRLVLLQNPIDPIER